MSLETKAKQIKAFIIVFPIFFFIMVGMVVFFIGRSQTVDQYDIIARDIDRSFYSYRTTSLHDDENCQYPNCSDHATTEIEYKCFSDMYNEVAHIKNNANLSVESDSFSYSPEKKHTARDTANYLVPQGDGSYKVEKRTQTYEYTTKGKEREAHYVRFSGFYCSEHAGVAKTNLLPEIEEKVVYDNPKFWIMCVVIPAVCGVLLILTIVIYFIIAKKRKQQFT